MSTTNKIWIALFSIALAGFGIVLLLAEPDNGIRPQDFKLKDIEKVIITNYPQEKEIILTDSLEFKPIIDQILDAKKTEIKNTRAGNLAYNIKVFYSDSSHSNMIFKDSPYEGNYFRLLTTQYRNDSLISVLNSLYK